MDRIRKEDLRFQVARQVGHWTQAALRLEQLEELAAPQAWSGLEQYLNATIRKSLIESLRGLQGRAQQLRSELANAESIKQLQQVQQEVVLFRKSYLKAETTLDFYADAINTRTNAEMAALLRACDRMAYLSMHKILSKLGKSVPPVLTYVDKGLGASILKAGLRLWDRSTISPVAAIKVVRHNLFRPTALIHETGHQIAHILNWNEELSALLTQHLTPYSRELADVWSTWSSEIAADTFAFVHTGYAAVASLHDVLSGNKEWVFRYTPFDPHPISYIRVLLGTAMCKLSIGQGPWEQLETVWKARHSLDSADAETRQILKQSIPLLPKIASICLQHPLRAFRNRAITDWLPIKEIAPRNLLLFRKRAGRALFSSSYWIQNEPLRLLALNGYQIATRPNQVASLLEQQRRWMLKLGKAHAPISITN